MIFLALTIGAIFIDAILLSSLFGFMTSSLTTLFLVTIILYFGITKKSILFGLLSALLMEAFFKYMPGSYVVSFLVVAAIIFLISRFLNLPSLRDTNSVATIIGVAIVAAFINYLFFFALILVAGFIRDDYNFLTLYGSFNIIAVISYGIEAFVILHCLKFLDKRHRLVPL